MNGLIFRHDAPGSLVTALAALLADRGALARMGAASAEKIGAYRFERQVTAFEEALNGKEGV